MQDILKTWAGAEPRPAPKRSTVVSGHVSDAEVVTEVKGDTRLLLEPINHAARVRTSWQINDLLRDCTRYARDVLDLSSDFCCASNVNWLRRLGFADINDLEAALVEAEQSEKTPAELEAERAAEEARKVAAEAQAVIEQIAAKRKSLSGANRRIEVIKKDLAHLKEVQAKIPGEIEHWLSQASENIPRPGNYGGNRLHLQQAYRELAEYPGHERALQRAIENLEKDLALAMDEEVTLRKEIRTISSGE